MRRKFRLASALLAMAIMLGTLIIGQTAWAIPDQIQDNQTVPTRTPRPPTAAPGPTSEPPTAVPPTATAPAAAPTSSATPTATAPVLAVRLGLSLTANPIQVWSGVTVVYTLTVTNLSAVAVRDVVLLDALPPGLEPGAIIAGRGAAWEGATLRATIAELAAGAQAQIVFTARVAAGIPAGRVIVNRAGATAGNVAAQATASIAMPPAELPAVGRDADRGR